jgi:hypothetical protein
MPAQLEHMADCASCFGVYEVPNSRGSGTYRVELGGENWSHCPCKGFEFRGECRHIGEVYKKACCWNPQYGEGKRNPELKPIEYTYDKFVSEPCPMCGGKMVAVIRAV